MDADEFDGLDPLGPARGFLVGTLLGALLWAPLVIGVWLVYGG